MRSYVGAFVVSLVVAALLTPIMRRLGLRFGAVSHPGGRHVHHHSIPRLGGIGIAIAFAAPLVGLFLVNATVAAALRESERLMIGLMIGGIAMVIMGVADDTRGIRAIHKLAVQVAIAGVAYALGFRIPAVHLPIFGDLPMGIFSFPVTVLWIVGVTNAVNLIDGLDGLAAGVVFFAAVTNFVVAYVSGSVAVAAIMAALMGSLVGFLFYNFNPAKIFMGDSGSYFLGFVLASTSLAGASHKTSTAVSLLVPIVALGVPIFDTLFSIMRRWLERRPLFSPDRGHVHHRLLDRGLTHRRAVLILYGVSIVFTVAAIGISLGKNWQVGVPLLAVTGITIGLVRSLGYFEHLHLRRRQKFRLYDHHTERLRRLMPQLLADLGVARKDADVWQTLGRAMQQAEFRYFEVLMRDDAGCSYRWTDSTREGDPSRDCVSAKFPIGRDDNARALIKFGWRPESEDVTPQNDILLQLVVDFIEHRLTSLGSTLVPLRIQERSQVEGSDETVDRSTLTSQNV